MLIVALMLYIFSAAWAEVSPEEKQKLQFIYEKEKEVYKTKMSNVSSFMSYVFQKFNNLHGRYLMMYSQMPNQPKLLKELRKLKVQLKAN